MSIFNDDRRYSDDPEEYLAWREEMKRECKGDNNYPEDAEQEEDKE